MLALRVSSVAPRHNDIAQAFANAPSSLYQIDFSHQAYEATPAGGPAARFARSPAPVAHRHIAPGARVTGNGAFSPCNHRSWLERYTQLSLVFTNRERLSERRADQINVIVARSQSFRNSSLHFLLLEYLTRQSDQDEDVDETER